MNNQPMLAGVLAVALCVGAEAVEFSKAGYWEAEGSPRRVETLTTGWEFSLDGFKTSKAVTLPHGIDEGELGLEASGCVNRQQPAWYRRRFTWTSAESRVPRDRTHQFLHFEAIMGKSRVTLNGKQVAEHFGGYLPIHVEVTGILKEGENLLEVWCDNSNDSSYPPGKAQDVLDFTYFGGIYRDAYLIETGEAYVADTDKGGVRDGHEVIYDGTNPLDPSDDILFFELNINFDTDKDVIKPEYFAQLDKVASVMLANPGSTAVIEGHADKRATSNAGYNRKLSERRAKAVLRYFEGKGISSNRLKAVGYGFAHPKAANDPVNGNLANRRVEVYIDGARAGKVNYVNPGK